MSTISTSQGTIGQMMLMRRGGAAHFVFDTFTDTDNTELSAHNSEVGSAWVEYSGDWEIASNQAIQVATTTTHHVAAINSNQSNCIIKCLVTIGTTDLDFPAVCFRLTNDNNFIIFQLNPGSNVVSLYKRDGGSFTQIGSNVAQTLNNGIQYSSKIICNGSSIKCYINDVLKIDQTSTFNASATMHGIEHYRSNVGTPDCSWDDFEVVPLI